MVGPGRREVARERARHEHARLALEQVLAVCRRSQIDVLPVKGILTARLFYGDPGERPIRDIDLRIRPRDVRRVEQAGRREGWRIVSRSWAYGALAFDVLGFLVEFESHVGPPGLCALCVDTMLRRARASTEPLGILHLQPELHDHGLLLCVNAFKDKLVDAFPGAIRDLEILPARSEFVSERFVALALECEVATIASIVARWLLEVRHAAAWRELSVSLAKAAPRRRYARLFSRAIGARVPPRQALRVLARAGSDRVGRQVTALSTMAVEPFVRAFTEMADKCSRAAAHPRVDGAASAVHNGCVTKQ